MISASRCLSVSAPPGDPGLPATQTEQLLSELEGAEGLGPNQLLSLGPFAAGITRKMPLDCAGSKEPM